MKCWCFNEEQLAAALKEYAARQPVIEVTLAPELQSSGISFEPMDHPKLLRDFLESPEARKHKLLMHGIWDREEIERAMYEDPAPAAADAAQRKESP